MTDDERLLQLLNEICHDIQISLEIINEENENINCANEQISELLRISELPVDERKAWLDELDRNADKLLDEIYDGVND